MPIREFLCPEGHVTEKVLIGEADEKTVELGCVQCDFQTIAVRQDIASRYGAPRLVAGCGGFHRPNA